MTGAFVDSLHGVRVWSLGDAPDHARVGIPPCTLKVDTFLALDIQIGLMSRLQGLWCYAVHATVNIHELWYLRLLEVSQTTGVVAYHGMVRPVGPGRL